MACNSKSRSEAVTHRIVTEVADAEDVSPTELPPLEEVIDTDSIESLFSPRPKTNMELRFEYVGYVVVVEEYGVVTLQET